MDSSVNGERRYSFSGCSRAWANQKRAALQSPGAPTGISGTSTPGISTGQSRVSASVMRRYDSEGISTVVRCNVLSPNSGAAKTNAEANCEDWEASIDNVDADNVFP